MFRPQDYSENKYVVHSGLVYEDFELQKSREVVSWLSSLEDRKSPHIYVNLVIHSLRQEAGSSVPRKLFRVPKKYYFKAAGSHGVMNHEYIDWKGEIQTEKEKSVFYSDAEVYVHTAYSPNFNEPFGLSMTEAQFCGVPVIGLQTGGITEVVYDPELIFDNFDDLFKCLRDKPYLRHRPEDIRQWTIDKFSHTAVAERYNEVFDRVLNED
jgi:glycosyltransferase involved in cell wall biosynthesis